MARPIPDRIVSRRLVLRQTRTTDAQKIFDLYTQDLEVARYTVWRPHTALWETEDFVSGCMHAWQGDMRMPYVLALQADEEQPIGMLEGNLFGSTFDIGYVLARPFWGQGLMPEAVQTLTEVALAVPSIFRVQATCDAENGPSARTLEKSGFVREGRLERHTIAPCLSSEPRACYMYARCR